MCAKTPQGVLAFLGEGLHFRKDEFQNVGVRLRLTANLHLLVFLSEIEFGFSG